MFAFSTRRVRFSATQRGPHFRKVRDRRRASSLAARGRLSLEMLEARAMLAVESLITETSPSKGIVPTQAYFDDVGVDWTGSDPKFDDSSWTASVIGSPNGIGGPIVQGHPYAAFASISSAAMVGASNTAFLRIPFHVDDDAAINNLTLNVRFDDGFIAYLNGQEILRQNTEPGYPTFPTKASASAVPAVVSAITSFDISNHLELLKDGANLLAFRGFDRPSAVFAFPNSQDFLIQATLIAEVADVSPTANDDAVTYRNDAQDPIINVLANDTAGDYPINPATVEIVNAPENGIATVNANGTITFSEDAEFSGADTFTYRVRDTNPLPTPGGATTPITVVSTNAPHRKFVPSSSAIAEAWRGSAAFDDTTWMAGQGGIGYDDNPDYDPFIGLGGDVTVTMDGVNSSIYARYAFTVPEPTGVTGFRLRMRFDDGFIAYINGVEVQRQTFAAGAVPAWNSVSNAAREYDNPSPPDEFFIPVTGIPLRAGAGANILAFQGLNDSMFSTDFLLQPELIAETAATGVWSNEATVTVNVTSRGPTAVDDTASTIGREPVTISVLDNDQTGAAPDNYPLRPESVHVIAPPANGVATVNPTTGEITYRANAGFVGQDTFEYTVRDSAPVSGGEATNLFLPRGSGAWRYLDTGIDPGPLWKNPEFNDTSWKLGQAELGFGDAQTTTIGNVSTALFRKTVSLSGNQVDELRIRLLRDDGAAIYFNGVEIRRDNLPPNASFNTLATATTDSVNEQTYFETRLTKEQLQELGVPIFVGENVVAAAVHQVSPSSSDLSFDLELEAVLQDGRLSNAATVTVAVASSNEPPIANDDDAMTFVGEAVVVNVLANDDPRGAPLDFAEGVSIVTAPSHGTATVSATGQVVYTPNNGFRGDDSFAYTVLDTAGRVSNAATVSVSVVSSVVVTADDNYFVDEDDLLIVPAEYGVLANDTSNPSTIASASVVESPEHGTLTLAADGSFQYAPNANFTGEDTFVYRATDSNGESATGEVTIRALSAPDAPIAFGDVFSTTAGTPLIVVAAPTARQTLIPAGATWRYLDDGSILNSSWRIVDFDDTAWPTGEAQFGYGDGDETTVISFGDDFNNRPITTYFRRDFFVDDPADVHSLQLGLLRDDSAAVFINGRRTIGSNISDSPTPTTPADTSVAGDEENTFIPYDLATTLIEAGRNVIAIEVHQASTRSNDMSFDLFLRADVAGPVTDGVLLNDVDPDGDALTAMLVSPPAHGTLMLSADGGFVYTPNTGFTGSDSFTYRASDGERESGIATVVINVTPSFMAADVNEDGIVDGKDVAMVVAGFGGPAGAGKYGGDINGDGMVNLQDAMAVRQAYGQKTLPASAPGAIVASNRDTSPPAQAPSQPSRDDLAIRASRRTAASIAGHNPASNLDAESVDRAIGRVTASLTHGVRALRRR